MLDADVVALCGCLEIEDSVTRLERLWPFFRAIGIPLPIVTARTLRVIACSLR